MIDVSKIINNLRRIVGLPRTPITTSLGVKMRNPFTHDGKWIGWTGEETASHLSAVRNFKDNKSVRKEI